MKIYLILAFYYLFNLWISYWISISVPWTNSNDIWWNYSQSISEWSSFWINIINKVNNALWFFIWVTAMAAIIYWWYLLVSSKWNEEDMRTANKLLTYWFIWVLVALSSYVVVRLIVNLM